MENKYSYKLDIRFCNPAADFREENVRNAISSAVSQYNAASSWAKNPKHISSFAYNDDFSILTLILQSQNALAAPGKALFSLSKTLVSHEAFAGKVYHAQLFRTQTQAITEPSPTPAPEAEAAPMQPDAALPSLEEFEHLSNDAKLNALYALLLRMKA